MCVYGLIFQSPKEKNTLNKKIQDIFTTESHLSFQSLILVVSILTEHIVADLFMHKYLSSSYFVGIWISENLPFLYLLLSPCRNEDQYKCMKIHEYIKHLDYYIKPFVAFTKAKLYAEGSTQKRQIQELPFLKSIWGTLNHQCLFDCKKRRSILLKQRDETPSSDTRDTWYDT